MSKTAMELASERVAKFVSEYRKMRGLDQELIIGLHTGVEGKECELLVEDLATLAQASQARTDGGAVAWHENARKALQGAVTGVIDTRKLEAIRICRAATGCSLKQARMAIEEMQATLAIPPGNATQADGAQWQPIETAPRDSRAVLVALSDGPGDRQRVREAWWRIPFEGASNEHGYWCYSGNKTMLDKSVHGIGATHWMPLPASPAAELKKG